MEIREKIDESNIRRESEEISIPIVDLILMKIKKLSSLEKTNYTLLAVCPNSEDVLKAAIRSAKRAHAPIKFAATLNQVDSDGGYTGWRQSDFVRKIKEYSYSIGYNGPIIVAVDHGGPWNKDIQSLEKWDLNKCVNWIKKSFEYSLEAGYELLHIDCTLDIFDSSKRIETVVERTVKFISYIEEFRKSERIKPISYEVGTEEVHGGLSDINVFKKFLKLLKVYLEKAGLNYVWPLFIVGKVGTDLHTSTFDPLMAKKLVSISKNYNSYIKGHYTDFVLNPEEYPKSGIGAANIGPEFTASEYDALYELCNLEEKLYIKNHIAIKSNFIEIIKGAVLKSGKWKKWLLDKEKDFISLSEERKNWMIKTCSRYIWALPDVKNARIRLYKNLELNGIDAENWVLMKIEENIDKYFRAFNLININEKIENITFDKV